jgi:hypothetical protein
LYVSLLALEPLEGGIICFKGIELFVVH